MIFIPLSIFYSIMVNIEVSVITDEFSNEFDEVCEHIQTKLEHVNYIALRNV